MYHIACQVQQCSHGNWRLACGADMPQLRYIYRPVLLDACLVAAEQLDACLDLGTGAGLHVPGFGVEMAVKNMEYSALDEKKVGPQGQAFQAFLQFCQMQLSSSRCLVRIHLQSWGMQTGDARHTLCLMTKSDLP